MTKTKTAKIKDFSAKHLGRLVGKTVKSVCFDTGESEFGVGKIYGLQFTDQTVVWILQDPEGNGPGHLDIHSP